MALVFPESVNTIVEFQLSCDGSSMPFNESSMWGLTSSLIQLQIKSRSEMKKKYFIFFEVRDLQDREGEQIQSAFLIYQQLSVR